jgi:glycosyltransferase involved in cell wall biosynthesis
MEIMHLILGKANPARMNGINKVVHELATEQKRAGFDVEVWGFTKSTVHDYPERAYTTRLFDASRNPFRVGKTWKQAVLSRKGTAVVQIHGGFVPRFSGAAQFLRKHRIPYLVTPHGNYNAHALARSQFRKKLYFRLFERKLLDGAAAIHVLGKSEIAGLQAIFPNQKSVLIPYGFSPVASVEPVVSSTFIIGFCGRLDIDHKGLDRMIEGFAEFRNRMPTASLWLIGDGPHRAQLEALVHERGLSQQVIFWGSQFGDDKLALLRQCSVFVHASRYEGLPVAVLEAASLGIPCLVSEATNVGDAVRAFNAGYVMEQGTASEVTEGLLVLAHRWQTGQLTRVGQQARQLVDELYNWPRQLTAFDQLYQRVWQPN